MPLLANISSPPSSRHFPHSSSSHAVLLKPPLSCWFPALCHCRFSGRRAMLYKHWGWCHFIFMLLLRYHRRQICEGCVINILERRGAAHIPLERGGAGVAILHLLGCWWTYGGVALHDSAARAGHCIVITVVATWGMGLMGISGRWGQKEGEMKTNHNLRCGSFLRCTAWASHFLGPPSHFSIPNSSVDQLGAAHIPLKRGGVGAARIWGCALAGDIGNQAHISQESGGAPRLVDVRAWVWIKVAGMKMVVVVG